MEKKNRKTWVGYKPLVGPTKKTLPFLYKRKPMTLVIE